MDVILLNLINNLIQVFLVGYNILSFTALIIVILCGVKYLRDS